MELNKKQTEVITSTAMGDNIFVTGAGGVGKSVVVNRIKQNFGDSTVFLAPTGIAALNIGGSTIHSVFKFSFKVLNKYDWSKIKRKTEELFDKNGPVKRIVIDEISMVRADIFMAMDEQLKRIRNTKAPFGGLQVIVVGDFYQLPPVVTNRDREYFNQHFDSPYAFSTKAWSSARFKVIELDEIMRQSDETFIKHLRNIRSKQDGYKESIEFFNQYNSDEVIQTVLDEDPIVLSTTNATATSVNDENYSDLEGEERVYHAKRVGDFSAQPADDSISLKYATKVIIVANNDVHKNGQIGYVIDFIGQDCVRVMLEDESEVFVRPFKWEEIDYSVKDGKLTVTPVGSFEQLPIRYAWGITIHKSQGKTLPNAVVDIGRGAFCHGQLYVALSRIKSLDGMALMNKLSVSDVIVDKEVIEFYKQGCRGNGLF